MTATLDHEMTDLRRANAELQRRLDEAVADRDEGEAQRAAIAEILEVINDSPGDLAKVFDAILEKAHRLCGASKGSLVTLDGEHFRTVAMRGLSERYAAILRDAGHNVPGSAPDRLLKGEGLVHVADARGSAFSVPRAAADLEGVRTIAYVPLRKESALLGYITAYRQEVRPFTDKQIALLQSFAAQTVIAMENARLITETREALEQQTATSEVLQIINSSPGDLGPVFDAMLEKATRLSEAAFGIMQMYDGERFQTVATRNMPPALAEFLLHTPRQPTPHSAVSRILDGEDFVHFEDMTSEPAYLSGDPRQQAFVELGGTRTYVAVALRKDDRLLGTIATYRQEIRPFSDKQIALLQNFAAQAVIAMENARLITETREALEQQTATADVLQVINSSLGDLKPVFDTMLDKAMRLCDAACSALNVYDGGWIRTIASRGMPVELAAFLEHPVRPEPGTASMRLIRGETFVHIADLMEDEGTQEGNLARRTFVKMGGARTQLAVPLRKDNTLLGIFIIYRQEVRPFTDKQITLLQNFAAQAVVAIENARLLAETREALEQQTATAEVLQVINSSPGDLAPVFDAMLERAMRLCEAAFGLLFTYDGEHIRAAALHNIPKGFAEFLQGGPVAPAPHTTLSRAIQERRPVQIMDVLETAQYRDGDPFAVTAVEAGGVRTVLSVPLLKDEVPVGVIGVYRQEVRSFSDKQIALLQNFAAQAVIAMENARLITETREALEQQTATAEVLRVINSSPGDLNPVFDAMLEKAMRLCGAAFGFMTVIEGEQSRTVAARGVPAAYGAFRERNPTPANAPISSRVRKGEPFIHTVDLKAERFYGEGDPQRRAIVDLGGARTLLAVPLMRDQAVLGAIQVYRTEVRPFSDKEIALLQNFAAQAVIAMENARLLTETREALEQQTATAEVLQAINSSPGDLDPVFEAILEKAHSLCGVNSGALEIWDGERLRALATRGLPASFEKLVRRGYQPGPNDLHWQLLDGAHFVHIADQAAVDEPMHQKAVELGGFRTFLGVALRKENTLLGRIVAARQEVRPFAEKEIALLQNFAAQAVIAMENARLLTETREALEQQTATAEVLQVINSSPGDLAPVFDAMLEKAMELCEASFGGLSTYDGEKFCAVATRGLPPALVDFFRNPYSVSPQSYFGQIVSGETLLHVADLTAESSFDAAPLTRAGVERGRAFVEFGNARTGLFLALQREGALLGILWFYRQEVRPFTDKQIALLQNFADQAMIAMENARLITETREALEQQTATAEVLQVINSSPDELQPVFDAILEKAHNLCGVSFGSLQLYNGEKFRAVAVHGLSGALADRLRQGYSPGPANPVARLLEGERFVHTLDLAEIDDPIANSVVELLGTRTLLCVALRKDKKLLGLIAAVRLEVRPFSDKQIALLENFAAQAVIAMENARLLTETRESLEQQTATSEVLQVINSSPGDLAPVFDAMLEKATRLCEARFGILRTWDGERFHFGAVHGDPRFCDWVRQRGPIRTDNDASLLGRIQAGERVVHITDAQNDEAYRASAGFRDMAKASGIGSAITVALHKDDALLGIITVYRQEFRPFSEKQIALLQNFAAQAVIAMENARLLTETREGLDQQTATAEVLQIINSSPGNLTPVFDAMLERAMRLCEAAFGVLWTYDNDRYYAAAVHGASPAFVDFLREPRLPPYHPGSGLGRMLLGEDIAIHNDMGAEEIYRSGDPLRRAIVDLAGARSAVTVSLRKDQNLLGAFTIYRQEVRAFTEKQIALLQNFAAQAVIAMENARLLTETREALEQQTATAEVLGVINSSPGDLKPVFEAMLERAMRLCEAQHGYMYTYDGERFHPMVLRGGSRFVEFMRGRGTVGITQKLLETPLGRAFQRKKLVHILDCVEEPVYHTSLDFKELVDAGRIRSGVILPLFKEFAFLGSIHIFRNEVRPFTEKQIALLQNFAAQAAIAMENARLLNEISQRQAELRVTFDNMVDGVAMFDAWLRLAAWNRNFQELLDLPDEFLAERHDFDTYIRYLTERGEFGETDPETQIKRLRARIGDHYSFERTRPDGTVIEVRHNPMPDGGIVLIYSDITERKRSEAEIHAARDAAEAAYRDLKAAQASLVQAEKMASLGQLTAGIAHEIKNPLNFVNNFAGLSVELLDELKETAAPAINALGDEKRAEVDETITMLTGNLEKIAEHGRRADGIVKSMLEHSRGSSGERRSVDLNGLIEEALNLAYHGARAQDASFNITLEGDFAEAIAPIELVPQDITRVCLNLIGNGFYAATKRQREGGDPNFKPTLKVSTRDLGDAVEINIRDNGVGIPTEIKDKLFQPFFTTKPTGEGTGLGLSISYDVVTQEHGGTITVDSRVGEFTEFTVRLPRAYGATIAEAAS